MQEREQKQVIISRMLGKYVMALVVYTIAAVLFLLACRLILGRRIWYETDRFYWLLHFMNIYWPVGLLVGLVAGYLVISVVYMMKVMHMITVILGAAENLYQEKMEPGKFPNELVEVENQFTQIQMNIQRSRQIAKETEQRKNDLIVYLAHDLKTPLTSVIGYLTLLHDEGEISEELRTKYLGIAKDKAERLEELINEFFEITRFNLTTLNLELSRVNLTRMIEQITYEFRPVMKEKGLECECHLEKDLYCSCDVNKLQRVFDNLMRNAINYSYENTSILVFLEREEESVRIVFENQGATISEEKLGRIFEQFYRLDTTRSSKSGGAGLGLAIAKEIVELHKGTLKAESRDERIRFVACLPLL